MDGFEIELEARGEELWVVPRGDLDLGDQVLQVSHLDGELRFRAA